MHSIRALLLVSLSLTAADAQNPIQRYLERPRFYILIGVNEIKVAGDNASLEYALVDIDHVKDELESANFKPLSDKRPLIGPDANYNNVKNLLDDIPQLPDEATVLIYYTGHSWSDGKDLWLQLYDNSKLGADGFSFASLLQRARAGTWLGTLELVVDSCYSGQATQLEKFSFSDLIGPTVILASSDPKQPSLPIEVSPGQRASAFTFALLEALGDKFEEANQRKDGILTIDDSKLFAQSELIDWKNAGKINGDMKPRILENENLFVLKYDPSKQKIDKSPLISIIADIILREAMQSKESSSSTSKTPETFAKRIQFTAQGLVSLLPEGAQREVYEKLAVGKISEGLTQWEAISNSVPAASLPVQVRDKLIVARAYSQLGRDTVAYSLYDSVLKQTVVVVPDQVKLEAAKAYIASNHADDAEKVLGDVLNSAISNSDYKAQAFARYLLGESYASRGDYKKAITQFKAALAANPATPRDSDFAAAVSSNLAHTYVADKKFSDAEKQYETTVQLNEKAGVPPEKQATDLEGYSKVLAANKKPDEASAAKAEAEALRENSVLQKIKSTKPEPKP